MAGSWELFERLRWDGPPPACPRCDAVGRCTLLPGDADVRRVWRCAACRVQFSVLTGTLLERTRLPLAGWRALVPDVLDGGPARELARRHRVTPETVRLLRARLAAARIAAAPGDPDGALARLLRLPAAEVGRIRRSVPPRRASHYGPDGDYR